MSIEISDSTITEYGRLNLLWDDDRKWDPATVQTSDFIQNILGLMPCYVSTPIQTVVEPDAHGDGISKTAVFVQAAHRAFDLHIPFGSSSYNHMKRTCLAFGRYL